MTNPLLSNSGPSLAYRFFQSLPIYDCTHLIHSLSAKATLSADGSINTALKEDSRVNSSLSEKLHFYTYIPAKNKFSEKFMF